MTTKKQKLVFVVALLCIIAIMVNYRYLAWFDPPREDAATPFDVAVVHEEIFNVFVNNSHGNICFVGLQTPIVDEWMKYVNSNNKSLFNVFAIGSDGLDMKSKEVRKRRKWGWMPQF